MSAADRRCCDDCGFEGSSAAADAFVDCCSKCGETASRGGPDQCVHCGGRNCMGYACPLCGGRFALDLDGL